MISVLHKSFSANDDSVLSTCSLLKVASFASIFKDPFKQTYSTTYIFWSILRKQTSLIADQLTDDIGEQGVV